MTEATVQAEVNEENKDSFKNLIAIKHYRLLIAGQFVSTLGDGVYALSLIWAMKLLSGSALFMSLVLTAEVIPTIIFGIFAGVLVDRGNQKRFMMMADIFRGLVVLAIVILFWLNMLLPWMLIAAAAVASSFDAFFSPAKSVAIRTIVPDHLMTRAQSLSSTIQTVVGLASPALAGVLLVFSVPTAFLFNAFSFFVSFFFILFIKEKSLVEKPSNKLNKKSFSHDLKTGLKTIITVPIIRGMIIYLILINFMLAPVAVIFPLFVDNASQLAMVEIAFFIGIFIGSITINLFSKFRKIVPMITGLCLMLGAFGILAFCDNFVEVLILIALAGIGSPLASIALQSLFLVKVPRELLGRSQSTMRVLLESSKPVSLLLTGTLLVHFSIHHLFLGIAIFGGAVVLLMILNPVIRKDNRLKVRKLVKGNSVSVMRTTKKGRRWHENPPSFLLSHLQFLSIPPHHLITLLRCFLQKAITNQRS
ncbi:MFS transporter [Falsibacillus albus]|uniref:MFS transporter n=1 Tax=Falsibacillus albus TaxID=2478915 RepID=A0A3L7JTQ3_9BACI|nr:MFS transporter [Falsibacillus albus]RLQ94257.1 MFS transporter [Falsibacillus albus]